MVNLVVGRRLVPIARLELALGSVARRGEHAVRSCLERVSCVLRSLVRPELRAPAVSRVEVHAVAAAVAFGFLLRILGLRLGLPYIHHWDERYIADSARLMIERSSSEMVPEAYAYFAPLARLTALGYRVTQLLHVPVPMPLSDGVALRWIARSISAGIAASGTLAVYLAARSAFGRPVAAFGAALLYAGGAQFVVHAHFGVSDASVVALTAWTIAASAAYFRSGALVYALLSVLAAGVTLAFKLPGLAAALFPVAVLLVREPTGYFRPSLTPPGPWLACLARCIIVSAIPAILCVCVLLNPHFHNWQQVIGRILQQVDLERAGHAKPYYFREPGAQHVLSIARYLVGQSFDSNDVVAAVLGALALFGVALSLRRLNFIVLLALVHAAAIALNQGLHMRAFHVRAYLPCELVLVLGFGMTLAWIHDRTQRFAGPSRRAALALAVGALGVWCCGRVWQGARAQELAVDARTRAFEWILARRGSFDGLKIATTPSVSGDAISGDNRGARQYLSDERISFVQVSSCEQLRALHPDYVVTASFWELDASRTSDPAEDSWFFKQCPDEGYRKAGYFPMSPYEERLDLVPTWDGRSSAVVLVPDKSEAVPTPGEVVGAL